MKIRKSNCEVLWTRSGMNMRKLRRRSHRSLFNDIYPYDFQFLPQSKHVINTVAGSSALRVCNS